MRRRVAVLAGNHQRLELGFRLHHHVSPILVMAMLRTGGAIAPIEIYRASFYCKYKTQERPPVAGTTAGMVLRF